MFLIQGKRKAANFNAAFHAGLSANRRPGRRNSKLFIFGGALVGEHPPIPAAASSLVPAPGFKVLRPVYPALL
jgi:hypothetical protein